MKSHESKTMSKEARVISIEALNFGRYRRIKTNSTNAIREIHEI